MTADDKKNIRDNWPAHYRVGKLARKLAKMIENLTYGQPEELHQLWVVMGCGKISTALYEHVKLCHEEGKPIPTDAASGADWLLASLEHADLAEAPDQALQRRIDLMLLIEGMVEPTLVVVENDSRNRCVRVIGVWPRMPDSYTLRFEELPGGAWSVCVHSSNEGALGFHSRTLTPFDLPAERDRLKLFLADPLRWFLKGE
jgi:hypothetical protein